MGLVQWYNHILVQARTTMPWREWRGLELAVGKLTKDKGHGIP